MGEGVVVWQWGDVREGRCTLSAANCPAANALLGKHPRGSVSRHVLQARVCVVGQGVARG